MTLEADPIQPLAPIAPPKRDPAIDALRGFALLGILLVNMEFFASPGYDVSGILGDAPAFIDRLAVWAVRFAAESKFYTIFSFLFGYGAALQMKRAAHAGKRFVPLFARRLAILLLIGLIHATLIWNGDILMLYAILGLLLLLFRRASDRTLLIVAGALLLVPFLMLAALHGLIGLAMTDPQAAADMNAAFAEVACYEHQFAAISLHTYAHGPWRELNATRLLDLNDNIWLYLFTGPSIFAMFLTGFAAGRRNFLRHLAARRATLRMMYIFAATIGITGNLAHVILVERIKWTELGWPLVLDALIISLAAPSLAAGYAAFIIARADRNPSARCITALAAVGRTALSNYLLQSLICTTIFYYYGLGLYGRIRPAAGIPIAAALFTAQIAVSKWWTNRYRFGPTEWLWRAATYRTKPPMRKTQ